MFPCVLEPESITVVELGTRGDNLESLEWEVGGIPPGICLGLLDIGGPCPLSLVLGVA